MIDCQQDLNAWQLRRVKHQASRTTSNLKPEQRNCHLMIWQSQRTFVSPSGSADQDKETSVIPKHQDEGTSASHSTEENADEKQKVPHNAAPGTPDKSAWFWVRDKQPRTAQTAKDDCAVTKDVVAHGAQRRIVSSAKYPTRVVSICSMKTEIKKQKARAKDALRVQTADVSLQNNNIRDEDPINLDCSSKDFAILEAANHHKTTQGATRKVLKFCLQSNVRESRSVQLQTTITGHDVQTREERFADGGGLTGSHSSLTHVSNSPKADQKCTSRSCEPVCAVHTHNTSSVYDDARADKTKSLAVQKPTTELSVFKVLPIEKRVQDPFNSHNSKADCILPKLSTEPITEKSIRMPGTAEQGTISQHRSSQCED